MNLPPGTEELFPSVGKILPSEEVLFEGLRKTAASFLPIPVVVRVAGGWVRDKVKKKLFLSFSLIWKAFSFFFSYFFGRFLVEHLRMLIS